MDVGDNTTTSNGSLDQSIQFFVSPDSQLQVTRCDTLDLQIFAGVSSQFQDLSSEVLQDGRCVDSGGGTNTVSLVDRVLQETMDTTNGELKTGLGTS